MKEYKITPEKLRIGNLVKVNNQLRNELSEGIPIINFFKVRKLSEDEIDIYNEIENIYEFCNFENIEPIELTEEMLFKLGAIKREHRTFPSFNLFGIEINYIDNVWKEYVTRVEIEGLHHLQNIFYFRQNEELNVDIIKN